MSRTGSDDLYAILGVARDASTQDIKKAFRQLARECHPDVAGSDPEKAAKFKRIRDAYEVLADPVQRGRYDRRGERRTGPFVGSFWNRSNVSAPAGGEPAGPPKSESLDLEDIFNDFGTADFGFGRSTGKAAPPRQPPPPPPRRPAHAPQPGRDIPLQVDVPADTAERGGTITVRYPRLRRADDGRTLYRYDELYDLRVPPGTRHGETLRVVNMGDAGANGGPFGELVCDVRVVGEAKPKDPGRMKMPKPEPPPSPAADGETVRVDVGVAEALLGGRVVVHTPGGPVKLSIPAGTSSGTRMRLRGRGATKPDGSAGDLFAEVRIVVPKDLDEESRRLIERFAELNPTPDEG